MNEEIKIKPQVISPLKKICMTIGELPTSYLETMTYYEMLVWFVHFLRDNIIPVVNNNGEAVTELQNLFIELQNYVNNYFEENFQPAIDQKLEEMVEDGTLANLLNNYASLIKVYDTFIDLVTDTTLTDGQKVKTLGYYSINDNGGAEYYITTSEPQSGYYEEISTGIYASILIDNQINFRQLGAKTYDEDSTFDNKDIIDKYVSICNAYDTTYELFIPGGKWCFSATLINRPKGVRIVGDKTWAYDDIYGSAILPLNDNQQYVWKLGGLADYTDYVTSITVTQMVKSSYIDGLCFTTMNGTDETRYTVSQGVFIIDRCEFCTFDNLYLWKFSGNGVVITSSWELDFGLLSIRQHSNPLTYSLLFDKTKPVGTVSVNISALTINNLYFERNDNYIKSEVGSGFSHNYINHINIETKFTSITNTWNTTNATSEEIENATPVYIFKGFCRYFMIGTMNITFNDSNLGIIYTDNNKYYMKAVICDNYSLISGVSSRDRQFNVDISQLTVHYGTTNSLMSIIYSRNMYNLSHIHIGSLSCEDNEPTILIDAYQSGNIRIGSYCSSQNHFNTSDLPTKYFPAYKNALIPATSLGSVSYDSTAPTEYHLVIDKDTTSNTSGLRFVWPYVTTSESAKTVKLIVKNKTDGAFNVTVTVKQNGSNVNKRVSLPVSEEWQELTYTDVWADYMSEVNVLNTGTCKIASFTIE